MRRALRGHGHAAGRLLRSLRRRRSGPLHRLPPGADEALAANPFRVFTSLLRLELIEDAALREEAARDPRPARRSSRDARAGADRAGRDGGRADRGRGRRASSREALETFRWHGEATVDADTYERLHDAHRLIADVVCFKGPHINHLTPRTLDIDAVQAAHAGARHRAQGRRSRARRAPPARSCCARPASRRWRRPCLRRRRRRARRHAYRALRRDRAARHGADAEGPRALRPAAGPACAACGGAGGAGGTALRRALWPRFEAFPDDSTTICAARAWPSSATRRRRPASRRGGGRASRRSRRAGRRRPAPAPIRSSTRISCRSAPPASSSPTWRHRAAQLPARAATARPSSPRSARRCSTSSRSTRRPSALDRRGPGRARRARPGRREGGGVNRSGSRWHRCHGPLGWAPPR